MALPLEIFAVLVAIAASVASRLLFRTSRVRGPQAATALRVLLVAREPTRLNDVLWRWVHAAKAPRYVRFGVVVPCTSAEDMSAAPDSVLRSKVEVYRSMHTTRWHDPASAFGRLLRRFPAQSGEQILVVDSDVAPVAAWDEHVARVFDAAGDALVCAPCASAEGRACFPRATASGRTADQAFATDSVQGLSPAVCWTPELSLGATAALLAAAADPSAARWLVPTVPLLLHDPDVTARQLGAPAPHTTATTHAGMVAANDTVECIAKYGSVRAARAAVRFGG